MVTRAGVWFGACVLLTACGGDAFSSDGAVGNGTSGSGSGSPASSSEAGTHAGGVRSANITRAAGGDSFGGSSSAAGGTEPRDTGKPSNDVATSGGTLSVAGAAPEAGAAAADGGTSNIDGAGQAGAANAGAAGELSNGGGACGVVLNEIQVASSASPADEFVELYNSCAGPASLSGHKLVYRAAAGTHDVVLFAFGASDVIASESFLVLGGEAYPGPSFAPLGGGMNGVLAALAGGIALCDSQGRVLDSLGYGNASNTFVETSASVAPTLGTSVGRVPDGHDSDDNWHDFSATTPTPATHNR